MAEDATVALVTTAVAKTWLKISGSTEDTIIDALVNRCSKMAATYCGRDFKKTTRTEYYDGNGRDHLIIKNFPIISVTSLHVSDANRAFDGSSEKTVADDVLIDKAGGILRLWNNGGLFTEGRSNIKIVYVAGYSIAASGSEVEVPFDLVDAALIMVLHSYKRFYQDQKVGIQSESFGERTINYSETDIPRKAKTILDGYRVLGGTPNYAYSD